ncbi:MAG: MlaD family protein [Endomicrobium sp.]|jgi:phospholipid/cholesterol/gamma-HCH transport system substrate-binding protein|nr:MlaD family protein [Endomicrobium sp.]
MNNQLKLGIFTALGLFAIIISIIATGTFSIKKTYNIYVKFDNISGLAKKSKVKIAGVDVGILKNIFLENSKAKLKLSINKEIILYKNSHARIISMGIIGTKYIEIIPGDSSFPVLDDGDYIPSSSQNLSVEDMLINITDKVNKVLDNEKYGSIMENLADAVYFLRGILDNISTQSNKITKIINNFNKFSTDIVTISTNNKQSLSDTIASMKAISSKLDVIASHLCNGNGVLPVLINDEQMADNLKKTVISAKKAVKTINETLSKADKLTLSWDCTLRYNMRTKKSISDIGITILPNNNKFYYVGVANIADNSSIIINNDEKRIVNKLEALLGFNLEKSEIYGGVIKGKAGIGIGYSFFQPIYAPYKTLKVHLNISDFTRDNRAPYISVDVRTGLAKWLYAGIAVEDIACKTATITPYLKVEIDDKDLARLFGIIGLATAVSK